MADPWNEDRIREMERRMAAMPGSRVFVSLAEEYRRAGRFVEALRTLESGLAAHPSYLSAQIAIARLYREMGRPADAIEAFSKVLANDRENLVAAKALADLHRERGNGLEAVKKLKLYRALSGDRSVDPMIGELERAAPPPSSAPEARELPPLEFPEELPMPAPSEPEAPGKAFAPDAGPDLAPEAAPPAAFEFAPMPEPEPELEPEREPATSAPVAFAEPAPEATLPEYLPEQAPIPPSRTLADLYFAQGHLEDARRMYQRLVQAGDGDAGILERIREIGERPVPAAGPPDAARLRKIDALRNWLDGVRAAGSGA
jgi:tetratricopeptide (TPR) repeat protein